MNLDGYISALGLIQANAIPAMSMADLYNKGGIYARVIDKPAGDAVARGFDLVEGDDDKAAQAEFDRLSPAAETIRCTAAFDAQRRRGADSDL